MDDGASGGLWSLLSHGGRGACFHHGNGGRLGDLIDRGGWSWFLHYGWLGGLFGQRLSGHRLCTGLWGGRLGHEQTIRLSVGVKREQTIVTLSTRCKTKRKQKEYIRTCKFLLSVMT